MCGSSSAKHSFTSLEREKGMGNERPQLGWWVTKEIGDVYRKWGFKERTGIQSQRQEHPLGYGSHRGALGMSWSHPSRVDARAAIPSPRLRWARGWLPGLTGVSGAVAFPRT